MFTYIQTCPCTCDMHGLTRTQLSWPPRPAARNSLPGVSCGLAHQAQPGPPGRVGTGDRPLRASAISPVWFPVKNSNITAMGTPSWSRKCVSPRGLENRRVSSPVRVPGLPATRPGPGAPWPLTPASAGPGPALDAVSTGGPRRELWQVYVDPEEGSRVTAAGPEGPSESGEDQGADGSLRAPGLAQGRGQDDLPRLRVPLTLSRMQARGSTPGLECQSWESRAERPVGRGPRGGAQAHTQLRAERHAPEGPPVTRRPRAAHGRCRATWPPCCLQLPW